MPTQPAFLHCINLSNHCFAAVVAYVQRLHWEESGWEQASWIRSEDLISLKGRRVFLSHSLGGTHVPWSIEWGVFSLSGCAYEPKVKLFMCVCSLICCLPAAVLMSLPVWPEHSRVLFQSSSKSWINDNNKPACKSLDMFTTGPRIRGCPSLAVWMLCGWYWRDLFHLILWCIFF